MSTPSQVISPRTSCPHYLPTDQAKVGETYICRGCGCQVAVNGSTADRAVAAYPGVTPARGE